MSLIAKQALRLQVQRVYIDGIQTPVVDTALRPVTAMRGPKGDKGDPGSVSAFIYSGLGNYSPAGGGADDTAVIAAADASENVVIDLGGNEYVTTTDVRNLTKPYNRGSIVGPLATNPQTRRRPGRFISELDLIRSGTKPPYVGEQLRGMKVLWLGTSIPYKGIDTNTSYPQYVAADLNLTVDNNAWGSSHMYWDVTDDPSDPVTVRALAMTESQRLRRKAALGSGAYFYDEAYNPPYPHTPSNTFTCDNLIKTPFAATPFDVVIIDHVHNDRMRKHGTQASLSNPITAVSTGSSTTFTITGTMPAVGDMVWAKWTYGSGSTAYAAEMVTAVNANTATIGLDTSFFAGGFVSGTFYRPNVASIFGAYDFVIAYIYYCAFINGKPNVKIILSSPPSEFTGTGDDQYMQAFSGAIDVSKVAAAWNLSYFDFMAALRMDQRTHPTWFPDLLHMNDKNYRRAAANLWTEWFNGGAAKHINMDYVVQSPGAVAGNYTDLRPLYYDKFTGTFTLPTRVPGTYSTVFSDTMQTGLDPGWVATGAASSNGAAPWGSGNAQTFNYVGAASYVTKSSLTFDETYKTAFDFSIPDPTIYTGAFATQSVIFQMRSGANVLHQIGIRWQLNQDTLLGYATLQLTSTNSAITFAYSFANTLVGNTKYSVSIEAFHAGSTYNGRVGVFVNGVLWCILTDVADFAFALPNSVRIGLISNTTGLNNTISFANFVTSKASNSDFSTVATNTFTTTDGKTVTVVNGVVTKIV